MYKKIIYILFAGISFLHMQYLRALDANDIRNGMLPADGSAGAVTENRLSGTNDEQVFQFSQWIIDSINSLLPLFAVGVFLFVGIRLGIARGNPEEFKKAWMQFVYTVVGIFIVGFAWAAVKLVSGLSI